MSDGKSRVSIGLPVFNGENYIREALDSILAQTYPDFELIISDNASTDRTEEICRAYAAKDERVRYFRNDRNLGAARNYNRVFELSSGEYFKWAAHDDVCAPEFLERCVEVLDREPGVSVCYPMTKLIDECGQVRGTYADGLNLCSPKPHERFREFFETQGLCHAVFGVIRASTLEATRLIGNYPASDRVLLGELALRGQFCELPEYLFYRRIHPQISTTANVTDSEIAVWFDPRKRDKIVLPRWRRFFEYLNAIKRVPLSWHERVSCYVQLGRFVLLPERWRNMGQELLRASRLIPGMLLGHRWGR
jgi:glycosyltransferase involved in cell wall biosynthesis